MIWIKKKNGKRLTPWLTLGFLTQLNHPFGCLWTIQNGQTNCKQIFKEIFLIENKLRKYELKTALVNCKQEGDSVNIYYSHLCKLWANYKIIAITCIECCWNYYQRARGGTNLLISYGIKWCIQHNSFKHHSPNLSRCLQEYAGKNNTITWIHSQDIQFHYLSRPSHCYFFKRHYCFGIVWLARAKVMLRNPNSKKMNSKNAILS